MKKQLFSLAFTCLISGSAFTQIVNIPDTNFKNYLLSVPAINTNNDNEIQLDEAGNFQGTINCPNMNISDFTGIAAFENVQQIFCHDNQLTILDLSLNSNLINLYCQRNMLTTLDISGCSLLNSLNCSNNELNSIDFSNNPLLGYLNCSHNNISSINIPAVTSISTLLLFFNPLIQLDFPANNTITSLDCGNSQLTFLDVSELSALNTLLCHSNQLTSLDVSSNAVLTDLYCFNNQLTSLNVANGNNENFEYFWMHDNPNLACVLVDDEVFSTTNWISGTQANEDPFIFDNGLTFSETCSFVGIINSEMNTIRSYPNPVVDLLYLELKNEESVQILGIHGSAILQTNQSFEHKLNLSGLKSGVYFIITESGKTQKFIKN